jgi:hypothetical protein
MSGCGRLLHQFISAHFYAPSMSRGIDRDRFVYGAILGSSE